VQGKSDEPVYLYIHDDAVEFRDASDLRGKGTQETQRLMIPLAPPDVAARAAPIGEFTELQASS
ncbi:unnamed protein product, partial [marine sediment metagenome]